LSAHATRTDGPWILGLSFGYHDSAVALLRAGELVAAAQEERFSRVKQDSRFPALALRKCLDEAGLELADVDHIFYYENPGKKLQRITTTYLTSGLRGLKSFIDDYPSWLTEKVFVKRALRRELAAIYGRDVKVPPLGLIEHHESHAASAFFASPFTEAAVLCVDGVGEWATTTAWAGKGNDLEPLWEIRFPHSLGLLYSAFTYYCGFKVDSGEYKLMGLAPYGKPIYADKIREHLIDIKPDGSFWLDMSYFDYVVGERMISSKFEQLFGGPRREPEGLITERDFDLAASVQAVLEEAILRIARTMRRDTGMRHLCLAGGVALNCVANGKLLKAGVFDDVWVQPASGDAGGALGAAMAGWHRRLRQPRPAPARDAMSGTRLGTSYSDDEVEAALREEGAVFERLDDRGLVERAAEALAGGHVVGWFQGRMEFGPRALGSRSILGDPRSPTMQSTMNLKIKHRESFRPFAPAVLEEHLEDWFELDRPSPFMMFVVDVQARHRREVARDGRNGIELLNLQRSTIPAVTHVDNSARVQTIAREHSPRFYALVDRFRELSGCPAVINTSFNERGEPIVESPADAFGCFMRTDMDYLAIGNLFLSKTAQDPAAAARYRARAFEMD
jgi:carbamoyltransferase